MDKNEFEYWREVTASSAYRWVEDSITKLNGSGHLYYTGGEDGRYMRTSPDGRLTVGAYKGAFPHIGEAAFSPQAEHQYSNVDEAFKAACHFGGKQFLVDMFSMDNLPQRTMPNDEHNTDFTIKM